MTQQLRPFEFRLMRRLNKKLTQLCTSEVFSEEGKAVELCALFSGGKDSTALLHALWRISLSKLFRPVCPVSLSALHFDHHTRSGQSTEDALWASGFCLHRGIPLSICTRLPPWAEGTSFQAQASRWRKSICSALAQRQDHKSPQASKVIYLTAHHESDAAETILMNILRGCGPAGLEGIRAQSFQPLTLRLILEEPQEAILSYLRDESLEWCEDSSNQTSDYLRNQVRQEVMPLLARLNPSVCTHLRNLGKRVAPADQNPEHTDHLRVTTSHPPIELERATSVHNLYGWISQNHPSYRRLITASQLDNLAAHARIWLRNSVKESTAPHTFVPLSQGWKAKISLSGVELVPVSQNRKSAEMMRQITPIGLQSRIVRHMT